MQEGQKPFRELPPVQRLLEMPAAGTLSARFGRAALIDALRATLDDLRQQIAHGQVERIPDAAALLQRACARLAMRRRLGLQRVINATGIVLHTNLGRAPLAAEALAAVTDIASGYCNLEFDLSLGRRGSRTGALEMLLIELTGAEAALAVNNGAAAVLLVLSALSGGGEVIVSRGELVEIGGGFRIPEVIRQGGARLIEVGSTNKTRLADYRAAIGTDTRVLLKVHQSNFRTIGFTEQTELAQLSTLAGEHQLLVVADLGSGLLHADPASAEPTLQQALAAGADVVTCSGDKLLGGPQAGLIVGRKAVVDRLRDHPLLRALRLDKLTLAALEVTLRLHRDAPERLPLRRMLAQTEAQLRQRAERLQQLLGCGTIEPVEGFTGGGALPEERIPSRALALRPAAGVDKAVEALRAADPVVVGRIQDDRLLLDMLTVSDQELDELAEALRRILT